MRQTVFASLLLLLLIPSCSSGGGGALGESCDSDESCASGVCYEGLCVAAEADDDGDGLVNRVEARLGTDPNVADTDGDGRDDLQEVRDTLNPVDTDGDGIIDARESASVDTDGDCLVDQIDPQNDVISSAAQQLLDGTCHRGVCGSDELSARITIVCDGGELRCAHDALPAPWVAEEAGPDGCGDGLDNDCDGLTDEGEVDTDGDGTPDCADSDDDGDDVPDDEDCLPLDARCANDCTDSDDDGVPDCADLCVAPYDEQCDDGIACTYDTCDPELGCVHVADDGECGDGNSCTEDVCAPDSGGCLHRAVDSLCDDGDPCTVGDACDGGICASGDDTCQCREDADCVALEDDDLCNGTLVCDTSTAPYTCVVDEDSVVVCDTSADTECRQTTCQASTGECVSGDSNEGGACDDGDPCTSVSTCLAGTCVGTNDTCECETDADCVSADDGDACNGTYYCDRSDFPPRCTFDPASVVTCPSTDDTDCLHNACDPQTGDCAMTAVNTGGPCDDGDICTASGTCQDGACEPGPPLDCDDGLACTADSCDPEQNGCVHAPDDSACDDDNLCTDDTCDAVDGCVHTNNNVSCDDSNDCTDADVCANGVCTGTPICECQRDEDCVSEEDGDPCNGTLICDTDQFPSVCVVDPATVVHCDDAQDSACSMNICHSDTGTCAMTSVREDEDCDDGDPCTRFDACTDGSCIGLDGGWCQCREDADCASLDNDDLCDGSLVCVKTELPYTCEIDPTTVVTCDANDDTDCSHNLCDPATGACAMVNVRETEACEDGDPCSLDDTCHDGLCVPGPTDDCDDDDPCTDDSCDPETGCGHSFNAAPCDDGNACTVGDVCLEGVCQVGPEQRACDDGNSCTTNTCDPGSGCVFTGRPDGEPCEDGDVCTVDDTCLDSVCTPSGAELDCDDGSDCTEDSCDGVDGCIHTPSDELCDDSIDCTEDACVELACETPPCVPPLYGCVSTPNDGLCDDDIDCTSDVCDSENGCDNIAIDEFCDDGLDCTEDSCDPASGCVATADNSFCDDGVDCTEDFCDLVDGCQWSPNDALCPEDNNRCTSPVCDDVEGCLTAPTGCTCKALGFGGSNAERVHTPDAPELSGGLDRSFTVEAWVRIDALNANAFGNQVVTKMTADDAGDWALYVSDNNVIFQIVAQETGSPLSVYAAGTFPGTGVWVHLAATVDATANRLTVYVNGVPEATVSTPFNTTDSDAPVYVGPAGTLSSPAFNGAIDEVRFWEVARSQAEVQNDMMSSLYGDEQWLTALWTFDDVDATSSLALDSTQAGHDLVFDAAATSPSIETSAAIDGCPTTP